MKKVKFNKKIIDSKFAIDEDNEFSFEFIGSVVDDYDLKEVEEKLDIFMSDAHHGFIGRNIAFIRTILADFAEESLNIYYGNEENYINVIYKNKKLFSYKEVKINKKEDLTSKTKIEYNIQNGLSIKANSFNNSKLLDSISSNNLINDRTIEFLKRLNDVSTIKINKDAKALIEVYKCFYNEDPDFMNQNINLKYQTMMMILGDFNVGIGIKWTFDICHENSKLPVSLELEEIIENLFPFGKIEVTDNQYLNKNGIKKITIIGENIRNYISKFANQEEILTILSRVIYERKSDRYLKDNMEYIAKKSDYPIETVEANTKLVRNIENELKKI